MRLFGWARASPTIDFGNDLITQYDQFGSLGLTDPTNFPDSYSFTTSPRFTGTYPDAAAGRGGRFSLHASRDRRDHRHLPRHLAGPEDAVLDRHERELLA